MEIDKRAQKIIDTFFKNCDSKDDAIKRIDKKIKGELKEFTAKGLDGYMAYGNGEAIVYLDNEEEPWILFVDTYGDKKTLTWG